MDFPSDRDSIPLPSGRFVRAVLPPQVPSALLDSWIQRTQVEFIMSRAWHASPTWILRRFEPVVIFCFLHEGEAEAYVDGKGAAHRMRPGDLLLAPECIAVEVHACSQDISRHSVGRFSARMLASIDLVAQLRLGGIHPAQPESPVPRLIETMDRAFALSEPGWRRLGEAAVLELVLHLIRCRGAKLRPREIGDPQMLERFQSVAAALERRLDDPSLAVDDLAAAAAVGTTVLRGICHQVVGLSPVALLRRVRIERACGLLRSTSLPLKAISARCGFADAAFFSRVFRQITGMSPSEYRTISAEDAWVAAVGETIAGRALEPGPKR